jgi:hypothetical protein
MFHLGIKCRRALLSGGGRNEGGSDLDGTPYLHVEAKRTETIRIRQALEQAITAANKAGKGEVPVVMTRQNQMATGDSIVAMRLDDFVRFYSALLHVGEQSRNDKKAA